LAYWNKPIFPSQHLKKIKKGNGKKRRKKCKGGDEERQRKCMETEKKTKKWRENKEVFMN